MRCKPGDLAVIVQCDYAENIGRLVSVVRRAVCPAEWGEWICQSEGTPMAAQDCEYRDVFEQEAIVPDAWLRPIRPGDTADSTESMKEKEAA